ncbi:hypothetical protein V474_07710 [Novosphingobium barchaimii LL02]|uniref:Uncharacterized protein n=1 Tax=Novosphingobium barchaimii LL02 TaxID=1114963 RepID=A0A0J8B0Q0_9SPHN|nr:hypothetical protein V474_07710 [Novosphingobium barchaimii LL02]
MGLDYRDLSLGEYLEALEAHNEAHQSEGSGNGSVDPDRLRRFMDTHRAS